MCTVFLLLWRCRWRHTSWRGRCGRCSSPWCTAHKGCCWQLPHILLALVVSASLGVGALSWPLVQDSQGKDVGCLLDIVDPHSGGADVDHCPLRLHPLQGQWWCREKYLGHQVVGRRPATGHFGKIESIRFPDLHIINLILIYNFKIWVIAD